MNYWKGSNQWNRFQKQKKTSRIFGHCFVSWVARGHDILDRTGRLATNVGMLRMTSTGSSRAARDTEQSNSKGDDDMHNQENGQPTELPPCPTCGGAVSETTMHAGVKVIVCRNIPNKGYCLYRNRPEDHRILCAALIERG